MRKAFFILALLLAFIIVIVLPVMIIICIAWAHSPFTLKEFWEDFLAWIRREPK